MWFRNCENVVNVAGPVIVVVLALIAAASASAAVVALAPQVGDRVTPQTAMLPVDGAPVKTIEAVDGVPAVEAVPSTSCADPHTGTDSGEPAPVAVIVVDEMVRAALIVTAVT